MSARNYFYKAGEWASSKSLNELHAEGEDATVRRGKTVTAIGAGITAATVTFGGPAAVHMVEHAYDQVQQSYDQEPSDVGDSPMFTNIERGGAVDNLPTDIPVSQAGELPSDQTVSVRVH